MNLQKYSDNFLDATLLRIIPRSVTPNQVTWLRVISLPFICYLLIKGSLVWGLVLFSISALTDAVDGAMARKRNQITELGKNLDALADRGLITLVAFIFIPKYFGWGLLIAILILESINFFAAYRSRRKIKKNPGANWAGKVKMITQCIAFMAIFFGILTNSLLWFMSAKILLYISLIFTFLQSFLYPKNATL